MTTLTDDSATVLQEWLDDLKVFLTQVQDWCNARGWIATFGDKPVIEPKFGEYTAPILQLRAPNGTVVFIEPVARNIAYGDGDAEIFAWPTMQRLRLRRRNGKWTVQTESGVPLPWKWSKESFVEIIEALTSER